MKRQFVITLEAKQNSPRSLHLGTHERRIVFPSGCKYAVVPIGFYGNRAYTVHKLPTTAARSARGHYCGMETRIINREGLFFDLVLHDGEWVIYTTGNRLKEIGCYEEIS